MQTPHGVTEMCTGMPATCCPVDVPHMLHCSGATFHILLSHALGDEEAEGGGGEAKSSQTAGNEGEGGVRSFVVCCPPMMWEVRLSIM